MCIIFLKGKTTQIQFYKIYIVVKIKILNINVLRL